MKNKKAIYILLPFAIMVWVLISYKIIMKLIPNNKQTEINHKIKENQSNEMILQDTFYLLLDYPDPFLRQIITNEKEFKQDFNKRKNQVLNIEPIWPSIKYYGLIRNKKTNELRINIKIEKENLIIRKNEEVNGLLITEVYNDSIVVSKNRFRKTIYK